MAVFQLSGFGTRCAGWAGPKAVVLLLGLAVAVGGAQSSRAQESDAAGDTASDTGVKIIKSHGYSYFGNLDYPADYPYFNYVNPDAPKGGEISLALSGTFDSMNPYSRKGRASALSTVMYESLLGQVLAGSGSLPADSETGLYGLLAESLEYPETKDWVIFHMRPEARFSDGTPVTAHDVEFSHNLLLDQGLQSYAEAVRKRVPKVEVLNDHAIKFYFAPGISRRTLIDQMGVVPVWSKTWYETTGARLDEPRLDISPGSGPYILDEVDVNRRVTFKRNPDYWGWHLPINVGRHNFDSIRLEYFADSTGAFEAFKAGEVTYRTERDPKKWASFYDFPAVDKGYVRKDELPDGAPPNMSGIVFNLGSNILSDRRVRDAVALGFNFEWTNKSLLYGLYAQQRSFATGTHLEAMGLPEGDELAFLKSLGDVVPEDMFTQEPWVPHVSDPDRLNTRKNLRRAMKLLDEAGWAVGSDGLRRNGEGRVLKLTFLFSANGAASARATAENFISNLKKMGIDAQFDSVDAAQFTKRTRDRDFDMVFDIYPAVTGAGAGLKQRFGSEAAAYSVFNPGGLASPMVDAIIERSLETDSQEAEDLAMRALDRALRHEFVVLPDGYSPNYWTAYWDMYEHPGKQPPYALGALDFWWYNAEKAEALKSAGALR